MIFIKRKFSSICIFSLAIIILVESHKICNSNYGNEPCLYLPAPPGQTPPCAKPGSTFCEYIDNYPSEKIQHLFQTWKFDHSSILTDESKEEFSSYHYPIPSYNYGHVDNYFPEPIYIPKPQLSFDSESYRGYKYIPPNYYNFTGYPNRRNPPSNYKYQNKIPDHLYPFSLPQFNAYGNRIWHRIKRTVNETKSQKREKRQILDDIQLCQTRSQFIAPRAALNNKGNWMYVVNMPEMNNQKLTQLVKSETCISHVCNGICNLPSGYLSKCEQKYVQKRLVALEGNGDALYNDVFWFPSCCICSITPTF